MKIKILIPALTLVLFSCSTELEVASTDIPPAVNAAFQARFAGAEDVAWEAQKENEQLIYEVEFKQDGKRKEVQFDADGNLMNED